MEESLIVCKAFFEMITEEQINALLKEKIDCLVKGVIDAMPSPPQAIYLVGGYGRGEGAWYEDESGIHPYNDFDLAVITDTPLLYEKTEALRKDLAKLVDIKWVDIDYYSVDDLASLTPTIHNVDLLEGSSLIYGQDVIKLNSFSLNKQEIGRQDLIILYWTRMWTFLGSWEGGFHQLNVNEARFFKNQMTKAILAACDMRLVKIKKYTTSYRERARLVIGEFKEDKNLCELVEWAIREKLRPSGAEMMVSDMKSLYFRVKDVFIDSFSFSLGKDSIYFINPEMTKRYYLCHTKLYLKHVYYLIRYHKSNIIRGQDVFYAMNFVFHGNARGCLNPYYIKKASDLLLKHRFINGSCNSWDELRLLTATARNNI